MKFLTNIDVNKNQLLNAVIQNLALPPAAPVEGQMYYSTVDKVTYSWNGTAWAIPTMSGDSIVAALNASTSLIDDNNLSANVNAAVTDKHSHNNKTVLDSTTASFLTAQETKVNLLTVTAATNLDTLRADTATNNSKVSNATHTGDVTGSVALTIAANAVTNEKMATIPSMTIKGNNTVAATVPKDLTAAQVKTLLGIDTVVTNSHAHSNKALLDTYTQTEVNLFDAVSKKHIQNTDVGTTSATFYLNTTGVKFKDVAGGLEVRNNADNAYADLKVNNLTVMGTQTTINSSVVEIGDNEITLNSDIITNAANSDGGIAVKRLMADNTTRKDAKLTYNISTNKWQTTQGDVTGTLVTAQITNKVTAVIGDGTATSIVITHNLNTRDLTVAVREVVTPYALVMPDIEFTTVNTLTVKFAVAPTASQYQVAIIG